MTNIEKQFFETFGIEPKELDYPDNFEYYPSITDRVLLELVCILNKHYCENYQCATMLIGLTLNEVKRCILVECLENEKHIRQQVRALFREEK